MSESRISSRPIQSCFQCRKRKIKCSKSYPCTPCILRGEGETCREVDRNLLHEHKRSSDKLEELVDRIQKLESTISVLSSRGSPSSESSPRSIRRQLSSSPYSKSPSPTPKRPCSRGISSPTPNHLRVGTPAEEAVMILEDFAMGHKVNRDRATNDFYASPFGTPSSNNEALPTGGLPGSHPWSLFVNSPQEVVHRLLCLLPAQAQIQSLLRFYVQRVDWYSKVIHVPTFMAETNIILSHISDHRYDLVNVDVFGVLLMVLSLAFHFADAALCEQLFLDSPACSQYAQHLYSGAQACLQYTNFIGCHTLEHLQTIVLMSVYQQNHDESDSQWALTGAAIKIAQNLGMSRLGNETGTRQYPPEWRSSIRREVGRRIWWCLVSHDWSHALAHQGTYSIHPSQNHTSLPANIDDNDLVEADVVQSKPLNVHTEMSSFLCRLRFVDIYRQMVDEINSSGYELEAALDMEAKTSSAIGDIKEYFQVVNDTRRNSSRPSTVTSMERTFCQMMGQARLLQLHRPFLFQGYRDSHYVHSRDQCVKAAQLIIQHLGTNGQTENLLRLWSAMSHCFTAAVVLFIDLCYLRRIGTDAEIKERRNEIQLALRLFRSAGPNATPVVQNAVRLLESLMAAEAAEESTLSKGAQQRSTSEDSNCFELIVRRVIMEASQGTRSSAAFQVALYPELTPTLGHSPTPFGFGTPSTTAGSTPEPLLHQQYLDVSKLSPSILLAQDPTVFSGAGMQFDEATMAGLNDFLQANSAASFFA
ncbi:hypothetical protein P691DRAFT_736145 [Macrolepiota fuliginosa MF-IS2]|uniref:Zn(2)-C6 fungal-type domain-containing protein n=1 Tax=Macrolepiota fuliginosa MF-IS2 TaxID=1400762 RepID=A0A9P6C0R9_9AGAR|nr:hypothetical protein P691DRAFT_736145 [Macrolepiota fuliginosa MF-IS2]